MHVRGRANRRGERIRMATMTFKACGELVALKSEATHCTVAGDVTMAKRRPVAASAHAYGCKSD
jgi:hypothetical protein